MAARTQLVREDFCTTEVVDGAVTLPLSGLNAGTAVSCPFHPDGGQLRVVDRGRTAYCTCTGERVEYLQEPLVRTPDPLVVHQTLDLDGDYLPAEDFAPGKSLGIKAPKGVGKTEWVIKRLAALRRKNPRARIIAIAPIRSLVWDLSNRLSLPHYVEDYPDGADITGSAAVCLNSICRIPLTETTIEGESLIAADAIVMDESESTIQAVVSGTMNDITAQRVMRHLRLLLGLAKRVILLDADLSSYSVDFVNQIRRQDPLHVVSFDSPLCWRYETTSDRAAWEQQVYAAVDRGEKVGVAMTMRDGGKALGLRLEARRPGLKVAVVNSDTAMDFDLSHINAWVMEYDVLIYSPSIGSGVSINIKGHFDCIFGFFTSNTLTAQGCAQMLHRIRHPRSDRILIYLQGGNRRYPTDPGVVRRQILTRSAATLGQARSIGLDQEIVYEGLTWDPESGAARTDAEAEQYLTHFCRSVAYRRVNGVNGIADGFHAYLDTLNLSDPWCEDVLPSLSDEKQRDINAENRAAKRQVKAEYRAELIGAEEICIEEARGIREPKDRAQMLAIERAYICDFYGGVDERILLHDKGGRGRDQSRALARLLYYQADPIEHGKRLLRLDWSAHAHGVSAAGLRHDFQCTFGRNQILAWYGVGGDGGVLDRERAEAAAKKALKCKKALRDQNIHVRADAAQAPFRLLSSVLSTMGLRLSSTRPRGNGERVRQYMLDLDVLAAAREFAAAELLRLQTGQMMDELVDGLTLEGLEAAFAATGAVAGPRHSLMNEDGSRGPALPRLNTQPPAALPPLPRDPVGQVNND
jgi:hypothetical protein